MADVVQSTNVETVPFKRSKLMKNLQNKSLWRGVVALVGFVLF